MEYRPQETAYLESTIGVPPDQQQSRSLVQPETRYEHTLGTLEYPRSPMFLNAIDISIPEKEISFLYLASQRPRIGPEPEPGPGPAPRTKVFGKQDTKVHPPSHFVQVKTFLL